MASKAKEADADAGEDAEEGAEKPKRSIKKLAIMGAAALLVVGGGGGGAYFFLGSAKKEQKVAAPAPKPPTFFDIPDVLVNLSNAGGERTQYLKVKLVLELADPAMVQQIQPVMPRVMDTFQVFLRELRPADLEGSAGVYRLKEELTRRVNAAIAPGRINAVLFKEMVVQ
ncbi:MAG: flagellar basal body-associated protein FliL [Variibacter sp.]|nr:flagellar basal body-associated protein FliL [Variibacter sp.]